MSWNTTAASNGVHALTAVARDAAGNSATSAALNVTVNNAVAGTPTAALQDVVWTSPVKVTVTGNSLQKTGGCDGCADAGAVSLQSIASGDGYLELDASETNSSRAIGLARVTAATGANALSRPNSDTSLTAIDFALMFMKAYVEVRENGVYKTDTAYATGDKFRVAVVNNRVEYRKNGVVFYTSATAPAYPLVADTSLLSLNATLSKVVITQAPTVVSPSCALIR
jgi:hypothetical protein